MSDQQTWAEALNINPDLLAEWSTQAPEGTPILVYCIEQGLVDYGEYMRWAQERYGLPLLQANYFQATFDPSYLDQAKLTGDWQPWMYPVDKWENITYIACMEPPQEPESPDVRYVLADPRVMRDAWGGTAEEGPPPVPKDSPALEEDLPDGLSASPPPFVLDLDNATFNIGAVTQVSPMPVEKAAPPATPPVLKVVSGINEAKPAPKPTPAPTPAAKPSPAINTAMAKKAAPARTTAAADDEDGAIKILFSTLRDHYSASLILKCSEQNARLYQWDQSLSPSDDNSKTTVNLSYPTFLRIVAKTNLPYHGYLVDSPAHHEFFAALGIEELPVCVTAIPIRFENTLWGMVVAFGTEDNQKMDSLNFAQEATEKLLTAVGGAWAKAS